MPYAMLAPSLPSDVGLYMGIFNFFIVLPESLALLALMVDKHVLEGNRMHAVMIGCAHVMRHLTLGVKRSGC